MIEEMGSLDDCDIELKLLVGRPFHAGFCLGEMIKQDEELVSGSGSLLQNACNKQITNLSDQIPEQT